MRRSWVFRSSPTERRHVWNHSLISGHSPTSDLKQLIGELEQEEQDVSYRRRLLHGKIDILRAELVVRLQQLGWAERARPDGRRSPDGDPHREGRAAFVTLSSSSYCQECGFQNPEAANYCARCGALIAKGEPATTETTQALSPDEVGDLETTRSPGSKGPALVVRAGGGRAGETFRPAGAADADRALARLRDLPRRRHRLAQPRGAGRARTGGSWSRTRDR